MAALASTDVTYTLQEGTQKSGSDCRYEAVFKVAFGDGALTYPSGGIPLTKAKLGCPTKVEEILLSDPDSASGVVVKMDYVNLKIRLYNAPAQTHTHDVVVIGGAAAATTSTLQISTGLKKEAASNGTIAGATSSTLGGIVSATLAVASLTEYTTAATVAAMSLYAKVVGW